MTIRVFFGNSIASTAETSHYEDYLGISDYEVLPGVLVLHREDANSLYLPLSNVKVFVALQEPTNAEL